MTGDPVRVDVFLERDVDTDRVERAGLPARRKAE